jgi:hypothetical protein
MKYMEKAGQMKQKPQTYVAYCTSCHTYVFMSHREEIVKTAANQHVEETHHTVIVGYEIHKEER